MDSIPKGISNLGNNCFISTLMQILNQYEELNSAFDSIEVRKTAEEYDTFKNWNEIRIMLQSASTNGTIVPTGFVNHFAIFAKSKNFVFDRDNQFDTTEFFLVLVECFHQCTKKKKFIRIQGTPSHDDDTLAVDCFNVLKHHYDTNEFSVMQDLFQGMLISSLISMDGHVHSNNPELFLTVDLPLAGNLYESLDLFVSPELLDGENTWYNEKTKTKEPVYKKLVFWKLPSILVICLKRFSPDGSKNNDLVEYPLELDLTKYVHGYHRKEHHYELRGVCNHYGELEGGHYTNFVKNIPGKWFHCNDEKIQFVNDEKFLCHNMAYCLFYQKKKQL